MLKTEDGFCWLESACYLEKEWILAWQWCPAGIFRGTQVTCWYLLLTWKLVWRHLCSTSVLSRQGQGRPVQWLQFHQPVELQFERASYWPGCSCNLIFESYFYAKENKYFLALWSNLFSSMVVSNFVPNSPWRDEPGSFQANSGRRFRYESR